MPILEQIEQSNLARRIREVEPATWFYLVLALSALTLLTVAWTLVRGWLRRRRDRDFERAPELIVDLAGQAARGPTADITPLLLYSIPVRLIIAVLAPLGRGSELPDNRELTQVFDDLLPGLGRLVRRHGAEVIRWPQALSAEGFARRFFTRIRMPGDRGKGTPWCSVAGRVESGGKTFMVGLTLCGPSDNSLGEFIVERPNGWLEMLSIRR